MYQLVADNSDTFKQISPTVTMSGSVKIGSDTLTATSVTGVSEDYFAMKGYEIAQGRGLQYTDMTGRKKVCVVGQYLNQYYYGGAAVGQTLKVGGTTFTIVGVMALEGTELEEGGTDDCVFVPYSTAARLSFTGTVSSYTITVQDTDQHREAKTTLESALYAIFEDDDAYTVGSMAEMVEEMNSMVNMVIYILAGIAAISLVVGGIGIMNIMLVSVTERTREIGIRKALGARESAIMRQFVIEAATTSALGGVLGIALGFGLSAAATAVIANVMPDTPITVSPSIGRGPDRLRRLRRHRHRLRLSAGQEGGGAEPHRRPAVRLRKGHRTNREHEGSPLRDGPEKRRTRQTAPGSLKGLCLCQRLPRIARRRPGSRARARRTEGERLLRRAPPRTSSKTPPGPPRPPWAWRCRWMPAGRPRSCGPSGCQSRRPCWRPPRRRPAPCWG